MAKRLPALLIATILVASLFVLGSAVADTQKVNVKVAGGLLNLIGPAGDAGLADVTLDGTDQNTTGDLGLFRIVDPRGTGQGWYLTMGSSDFEEINDAGKKISSQLGGFKVTNANLIAVSGNGNVDPDNIELAPADVLLDSPSPDGRGVNTTAPSVELQIPAETFIGTYSATVTATLTSW